MNSRERSRLPLDLRAALQEMEKTLETATKKLCLPISDVIRQANLARIALHDQPADVALEKLQSAAAHFRAVAKSQDRN